MNSNDETGKRNGRRDAEKRSWVAIACGGTGGHLFPGIAVAEELLRRGYGVTLLVSGKQLDAQIMKEWSSRVRKACETGDVEVAVMPAVGMQLGAGPAFLRGFVSSYQMAKKLFQERAPEAVLGMGGFTSAPAIMAAKRCGLPGFLHESNRVAGRANRWLSRMVKAAFVGFPNTRGLRARCVKVTGTPVRRELNRGLGHHDKVSEKGCCDSEHEVETARSIRRRAAGTSDFEFAALALSGELTPSHRSAGERESTGGAAHSTGTLCAPWSEAEPIDFQRPTGNFQEGWIDADVFGISDLAGNGPKEEEAELKAKCRRLLGLDEGRPVVIIMGGSQGASGLNDLVLKALPVVAEAAPELQWFHLAGQKDAKRVEEAYARLYLRAVVHPFFNQMELALGAATVAVSRAGASALAELAAMRVPAVLVPYPSATDNHQFYNALAFEETGAARILEQKSGEGEELAWFLVGLVSQPVMRQEMQQALGRWHSPSAAEEIVEEMLKAKVGDGQIG